MSYIKRLLEEKVDRYLSYFPITAILGPRQCGKSTLAREIIKKHPGSIYLDLELPSDRNKLNDPETFLSANTGNLVCLDEIQRTPDIFPILRSICDRENKPGRYLLLGSASPDLLRQSSETLAGRIGYLYLSPFQLPELPAGEGLLHWLRGGFPRSFLAPDEHISSAWRTSFIQTYLERDIPSLGFTVSTETVRKLWTMLAHLTGQILNKSKLAESLGVTHPTIQSYIDILESTFMVRTLRPYGINVKKRLVKSPKIYIRDSGIIHTLLGIHSMNDLAGHPVYGSSWESYAVEQITTLFPDREAYFYRTSNGSEIDLILVKGPQKIAIEMKAHAAPKPGAGFYHALEDTEITEGYIVSPLREEETIYSIGKNVQVTSIRGLWKKLRE